MTLEEITTLPEAKASVVITLKRLNIHSDIAGEPVTLTTVEGCMLRIPAHLQEIAKRIANSGVDVNGKRGRLTKLLSDIEHLHPPCEAAPDTPTPREIMIAAIIESISARLEENGAVQALVGKIADHISDTVTLEQMAESISSECREEVVSKLGDAMIARFRK
jgi:hypothetical protein